MSKLHQLRVMKQRYSRRKGKQQEVRMAKNHKRAKTQQHQRDRVGEQKGIAPGRADDSAAGADKADPGDQKLDDPASVREAAGGKESVDGQPRKGTFLGLSKRGQKAPDVEQGRT